MLTFPFPWRRRLAQDGALLGKLTRIFVETVHAFYAERAAREGALGAKTGAVTVAVDVLACPKCQGRMRLLAMVEDPANVARFLAAMGEATEVPRSPPRGPPYWKSRLLRLKALGEEDEAQVRWVQETA